MDRPICNPALVGTISSHNEPTVLGVLVLEYWGKEFEKLCEKMKS